MAQLLNSSVTLGWIFGIPQAITALVFMGLIAGIVRLSLVTVEREERLAPVVR